MKDWKPRQLKSWLDAHGVEYGAQPPELKDRHYVKYLLATVERSRSNMPKPSSEIEIKAENLSASEAFTGLLIVCPVCMANDCDCNALGKWVHGD